MSSLIGMMAFSCNKNSTTFSSTDFSHSGCKTISKSVAADASSGNQEMLVINSENRFLYVKHNNAIFNCCPGN